MNMLKDLFEVITDSALKTSLESLGKGAVQAGRRKRKK